jgi:hypothetical protein
MIDLTYSPADVNGRLFVEAVATAEGIDPFRRRFDLENADARRRFAEELAALLGNLVDADEIAAKLAADAPAVRAEAERPRIKPFRALAREYPHLRPPVIHGLLRRGETMNVIAPPKAGKSWLVTDLALSIATGRVWLGTFAVEAGKVLILDNELHGETTVSRVPRVAEARGILFDHYADGLHVENLRGRLRDIFNLGPYFNAIAPSTYRAVILDAFYRFLPEKTDENDNALMARLYNQLDAYADRLGCCFVLIHHSSKGVQGHKNVTDVGAGAGAQARATDTHLVLRQHEEDGVVVLDAAVRSWPPINPMCLRWGFPVWNPDASLDAADLRVEGRRKRKDDAGDAQPADKAPAWTPESFAARFITEKARTDNAIIADAEAADLSERKARRYLLAGVEAGLVHVWHFQRNKPAKYANVPQPVTETVETEK